MTDKTMLQSEMIVDLQLVCNRSCSVFFAKSFLFLHLRTFV